MVYIFHVIWLIIAAALQGTLMKHMEIFGTCANLFLVYAATASFLSEKTEGVLVSGMFGLVLDIITGRFIGLYTVLFVAAAFGISGIFEKILKERKFFVCFGIVLCVSFVSELFYYLAAFTFLGAVNIKYALFKITVESVYNAALSSPMYFVIKKYTADMRADKGEYIE